VPGRIWHASLERALTGVEDEFCSRKPATGGWSITEIVEHLVIIEERVPRLLQLKLPEQELASKNANARMPDSKLVERLTSDTIKTDAPESAKPTGRYHSCCQPLDDFGAARQRTLIYVRSAPPYLRDHLLPHPMLGPIDGTQWLLFLAAHTQRHVKQIAELKAAFKGAGGQRQNGL
jgi:DinB superfamily